MTDAAVGDVPMGHVAVGDVPVGEPPATGRGLLVDYGGVLTADVGTAWRGFELAHGMRAGTVERLLRAAYRSDAGGSTVARYERGEIDRATFEAELAGMLADLGHEVDPEGLVHRLFAGLAPHGGVWDLVAQARDAGHGTALLSNSWGFDGYPRARLEAAFDVLVISGEVGLRKPDRGIFQLAAQRLGVALEDCVFVDDLPENVDAAARYGITAVLHHDADTTSGQVRAALGMQHAR